jgi:uncharacterized sulfatase
LKLAGVEIPEHMQGQDFLSDNITPREYIYAGRDRMDERYDIIRAVRNDRFKYIRNYDPYRPYDQYLSYPESHVMMPELRRAKAEGLLNEKQLLFFRQVKPLEEFYDLKNDPFELNNLADSGKHADTLQEMRDVLEKWMRSTYDPALIPEAILAEWPEMQQALTTPTVEYSLPDTLTSKKIYGRSAAVWLVLLNTGVPVQRVEAFRVLTFLGKEASPLMRKGLLDPLLPIAYWAAIGLGEQDCQEPECLAALRSATTHSHLIVKIAAAQTLAKMNNEYEVTNLLIDALKNENQFIRHLAALALESFPVKSGQVLKALDEATKDSYDYTARVARHAME